MAYFSIRGASRLMTLLESNVEAWIYGHISCLEVTQKYRNPLSVLVEAQFSFPVDPTSVMYSLEFLLPHEHIVAQVKEKSAAKDMYDEAIRQGRTAVTLDYDESRFVNIIIGHIDIGAEVVVKWKMSCPLLFEGQSLRFVLPTTVSSRYTPYDCQTPSITAPNSTTYSRKFMIHIDSKEEIDKVESTGCETDIIALDPKHKYYVKPSFGDGRWVEDLVLVLNMAKPMDKICATEKSGHRYGVHASMYLQFPDATEIFDGANSDFIFLADRSDSMAGGKMKGLKDCLEIFLKSLPIGCRFNIIGFGSSYEAIFPDLVPYDEKNVETAIEICRNMEANLGVAELMGPLQRILQRADRAGRHESLFVLTDGEISNAPQVLNMLRTQVGTMRLYLFVLGKTVSHSLMRGLAEAGNGSAEFVIESEDLNEKVIRALDLASKPVLKDLKLDFGGLKEFTVHPDCQHLIDEKRISLGLILSEKQINQYFGKHHITITGDYGSRRLSFSFEVDFSTVKDCKGAVFRMAAFKIIKEMEKLQDPSLSHSMTQLSLDSSVLCSNTTIAAISKRSQNSSFSTEIPVSVQALVTTSPTQGPDNQRSRSGTLITPPSHDSVMDYSVLVKVLKKIPPKVIACKRFGQSRVQKNRRIFFQMRSTAIWTRSSTTLFPSPGKSTEQGYVLPFENIMRSSNENGSWGDYSVISKLGFELHRNLKELASKNIVSPEIVLTVFMLTYLERFYSQLEENWVARHRKVNVWLDSNLMGPLKGEISRQCNDFISSTHVEPNEDLCFFFST